MGAETTALETCRAGSVPMTTARASRPDSSALATRVLGLLDLTSLGEDDTPQQIERLCIAASTVQGLPAAICVYPEHITTVRRMIDGRPCRVASVVNFPDGSADPARIARETRRACAAGADEIDLVFAWRAFLDGHAEQARQAIDACRAACGAEGVLKLILETGELASPDRIAAASRLGIASGVDFLKTSTGKVAQGATPEAAAVMLDAIAESGSRCGLKLSGGIRTMDQVARYLQQVEARMGSDWISPQHLRFGASALFAELCALLESPR